MDPQALREQWLSAYLLNERGLAPMTSRSYHFGALVLERFTGKIIFDVTTDDYRRYVRESDHSAQHKGTVLSALKSSHKFYCLENNIAMNGIMALSSPRSEQHDVEAVTREQARILLASCRHVLEYRLVYCGLFAGLRINETSQGIREIDFDKGSIKIFGKGRKYRLVPIHDNLREVLRFCDEPCEKRQLEYRVQVLKQRCDMYFRSHMLRAGFARRMEELERPHMVTKSILGHAGDITSSYTGGTTWKKKVEAMTGFDY